MAVVTPFRGVTYDFDKVAPISRLVAPPYDVISEEEQAEYYRKDPHNVIRLILGEKRMGDTDWDNRYTRSADCFRRWLSEDVFIQAESPSMYLTTLDFDPGDGKGRRTRWGLIAAVRVEDDGSGVVLPHEKTFSAHKDDRLKLMRASDAQFSQIFSLFEDEDDRMLHLIRNAIAGPPRLSFEWNDGTAHRMWIVQDPRFFADVSSALREKRIFIADGHHRYETTRNYRNLMRARYVHRPSNRSYEFVMMYLTGMTDPGLVILPSHRLIRKCEGFDRSSFLRRIESWFEITPVPLTGSDREADCRRLRHLLEEKGLVTATIGFHVHGARESFLLSLLPRGREEMGEDLHPALKKLDVLVLSRLILQKGLNFTQKDLDNEEIFHYHSDLQKTVSMIDSGSFQMGFLINPTRIEQVREVASQGLIMPRKSTYFYPKVISGLVFNKIDPHEIIHTY
jgi:uncharacterized protein (DUF1015 family)